MRIALRFLFAIGFFLGTTAVSNAQAPVANFSATPLTSCSPLIVQFTDLSTDTPTSWSWNLGNGITSTLQNPSTTYTIPGTYTVSLTATNASGSDTQVYTNYITVIPAPTVNFVANDSTAGCGSKTVTMTNLSNPNASGTATYYWDFGDGVTSTAQNPPTHTYSTPGVYTISLVVTNSSGCVQSLAKTGYITVLPKPTAAFTATSTATCSAPLTTNFSNTSTGAVSSVWDFGDGSTSTAASPSHTYATSGSFTVRLITTGSSGCKDTVIKTGFVTIGVITAGFTAPSTGCTKSGVAFTNTSIPTGAISTWYFGDGTTSAQASPVHTYSAAGTYTVKLVVAIGTCSDSTTRTIVVTTGPNTSFSGSPQVGCKAPLTVNFSNTTAGGASYLWLFGDGTTSTATSPSHTYNAVGRYTVKLISYSANGCPDTLTKNNFVAIDTPTATLGTYPFLGCAPAPASFTAMINSVVPVSSYSWNFGDGTTSSGTFNASHTYAVAGTYTVTVTMTTTTGCVFTASQNVIVGAHTTPAFTANPTTVCLKTPISFTNGTTGGATTYLWLFGDGGTSTAANPTYVYGGPGIFNVTLISTNNGCADTIVRSNYITVHPPKANFTSVYSCSNRKQFTFTNTSVGATNYAWSFGDGATDTATNPVHTYASYGAYTVRLIASSTVTGCVDTMIKTVQPFPLTASFSTLDTSICRGSAATFNPNNTGYPYYAWDFFGTGYYSYSVNPTPTFPNTGTYSIKLLVKDAQNCADSLTRTNYISVHAPTASFTESGTSGCSPLTVTFTDNSTSSAGKSITGRTWNFGDGSTLTTTATTVPHVYTAAGTYSVKLTVTETGGCTDEVIHTNVVQVFRPVANFYSPEALSCKGRPTTFVNTSTGRAPLSYSWTLGDGGTSTATNPTNIYPAVGNYSVGLIVTDSGGCKDTILRPAYIDVSDIKSGFTMSDSAGPCPPFTVSFTNASIGASTYLWMFGNGGSSTLANPSAAFLTAGTFTVRLIAINANGCRDTSSRTIVIGTGPTGTFSYSPINGCSPLNITFNGSSAGSTSLTYDFGNGATTTTAATSGSVSYTYVQPGRFRPTLILSDINGCSKFILGPDTISVNKANAAFSYSSANSTSCVGVAMQFTDASTAALSGISSRTWDFGDGSTSTAANPTHTYAAAGTYNVRLIASTPNGCLDTLTQQITINPLPVITAANQTICGSGSAQLTANGAASYAWSPATGLSCTNCANPVATPTVTTIYKITGTSAAGCVDTGLVTVNVNTKPVVSAGAAQSICSGATATLTATGAATYIWSPSAGLSATTGASVIASPIATETYTVIGTTAAGCSDTDQVTITVNPIPVISVTPSQTICAGSAATLTAIGATTYSWSPAAGLSSSTTASVTASPSTTTTYTVTGTANGCSASASTTITVIPIPVVSVTGNNTICEGASTALTATGAAAYSWSPATGLSCANCDNPTASPATTTTYTVTGTASGCSGTAAITVTVNPLPVVQASADVVLCAGASTTLSASGASTYVWSPAAGLSSTTAASPVATPLATTKYFVVGTDANGCFNIDSVNVTVNPLPVVSAGTNTSICPGGSANLTATGAASYSWTPSTGLSCTSCANPVASPSATTTYKVVGTSAAGCIDSSSVTVAVNTTPVVTVSGRDSICIGGSTVLTAAGANAFSWSPSTGLSTTTGGTVTANPASTTTYTITGTSGVGCTGTTTVTVVVNQLPIVLASADTAICAGASATLSANGASSYVWSPASGLSSTSVASPVATPLTTTNYIVTGTDANGCVNADSVVVTVNPLPVVSAGSNTSICPGGSANLNATGAASYSWTPASSLSCSTCANPVASPSATTTYMVTGTSAAGCSDTSSVTVAVNSVPVVTVTGTNAICIGGSTVLTAAGANTFAWSPATGLSAATGGTVTASPSTTTTYTITGTSGVGCTGTTTFTVTVNPLPTVSAGPDTSFCAGSSVTLNAAGAATYVWAPVSGLSCTNCASPVASPTATTSYVVTGTSAAGCVNADTIMVSVNALPTVSAGSNTSVCPGGSSTLNATGAVSYVWTPAATLSCAACASPVATPTATTSYTVTGTGANGCTDTSSVTVAVNGVPVVTIAGNNSICTGGNTVLMASGANSFSWSPATGLSATTGSTVFANPTTTTTYTITGTSGVGCTGTTTFTVTVNPLPIVSAGPDVAICSGASTTLSASGAATYAWTPAAGLSATTGASVTANPASTGTYIVTGTSVAGCVNTDTVIVTVNPLPVVSAGSNTSICPGGSATLAATGGVTYSWSPATGLSCTTCANPVASPAATTTYTVTGTSADGCSSASSVTVSVNQVPVITVSGPTTICEGANTSLTAAGASSYVWSPATGLSSTTGATVTASPAATTTYTVTGTSGVGCTGSTTVTITVNPLPLVTVSPDITICSGSITTLTASGASTYAWSPATGLSTTTGASTVAAPTATTMYTVTGTSAVGCQNSANVTVTVDPLPIVSAGNNATICIGGSTTLTATGAASYVWTPAATLSCAACASPVATPSVTTTYTVVGTASNGCTNSSAVTVSVNQLPVVSVNGVTTICLGNATTLTATGASSYSWSPATGLSCTTCPSPNASPATTTTYTVTGTSGAGCTSVTNVTVTVNPLPVITVSGADTACLTTAIQLLASGAATYAWSPAAGLSCTGCPNPVATPSATTTYTVVGTDVNGCSNSAQKTLSILSLPVVDAGPDVSACKLNSVVLNASGAASYVWSPATDLSCTTCTSPIATPAATTFYVLTGTGANGCVAVDTVNVIILAQPPVNAGPDQTICAGNSAQLQASGASNYVWSPATDLSCVTCANPVATPVATITYKVSGTDMNGCHDSDLVTISVIQRDSVSIDTGGTICIGESMQLQASGGNGYTWTPTEGLSCTDCPNPVASPDKTTTYSVVIRQGQCFSDTLRTTVIVHPLPTVNAGPDQSIILGTFAQIKVTGTNISKYSWTPYDGLSCTDCATPTTSPKANTTYVVTVVSEFGCTASDDIKINVRCDDAQVWMPNTFTPNADGQNDFFYPHGKGLTQITRFRIYDRWGELIYDRMNMPVNDRNSGWDGTYKNQTLKPDVFVWILNAVCTNGEPLELKGDISLIR